MAPSKLAILSIFLALIFSQIRAETKVPNEENERPQSRVTINEPGSPDSWGSNFKENVYKPMPQGHQGQAKKRIFSAKAKEQNKNEQSEIGASPEEYEIIQRYLIRISSMELQLKKDDELIKEQEKVIQGYLVRISSMELQLKKDDELIKENEKVIQQESDRISSLRSEIESLQKNGSLVEQQVGKAQARADELEKKVNELEQKLQSQRKEKEDLESLANEAEEKIYDLPEIENIEKTNEEQETKIRRTEHALEVKVAEVNELENELQQHNEKGDLKDRVNEAEKNIDDLLSKIENVQGTVKDLLKTRPLATKEMEWFAASALLALLIIFLFRNFSTFLYKH